MKFLKTLLVFPLVLVFGESTMAQQSMTFDASTSLLLQELNAMLVQNNEGVQVEMILGGHGQAAPTSDELQKGDAILMMNGERITNIGTLREIYESIPDDEEIKLGVRRDNQRFIVRGIKGDIPESGPGRMVFTMGGESDNPPIILTELGLVLADNDADITIQAVLDPVMPNELKALDLLGYNLLSINDNEFHDAANVQAFLAEIEVGEPLDLVFEKDGEQKVLTLPKPESRAAMTFSTNN